MKTLAVLTAALFAATATAQAQGRGTTITGVVYDSLAKAPLAGAVVQVVRVDSGTATRNYTASADALGRFRVDSLPRGKFGIGFQHPALEALGLESPLRAFQIGADTTLDIDLAIPSGHTVRAERCPGGNAADGMLAGYVLDAAKGGMLAGATVTFGWTEVGVLDKKLQTIPKRMQVKVGDDGNYVACGLASGSPLTVDVSQTGYRAIIGEVIVPDSSAMRRDFRLADTTAAGGGAVVGKLAHADGSAVSSGQVSIPALDVEAPVVNGAFTIANVPPGTWMVEARVLGFEPQNAMVDVGIGAPASLAMKVGDKVQLLDAVTVIGKPTGDIKVLSELVKRNRASAGTMFLPGNVWLESALYPADVLRAARGFRYMSLDKVRARGCDMSGAGGMGRGKSLVVYIDGMRFAGGFEELGTAVTMREVLAIEAYPDMISVPAQWRSTDTCAVIAIWTKR
ncbi:MAG: carboxypeptidase regulatory-like domain-containing protein [Gemmatimonadaceae bacterium]